MEKGNKFILDGDEQKPFKVLKPGKPKPKKIEEAVKAAASDKKKK